MTDKSFAPLGLTFALVLLIVALRPAVWTRWQENLSLVSWLQLVAPQAASQLPDLYSIRSDVTIMDRALDIGKHSLWPKNTSATVITMALANDYQQISDFAIQSGGACLAEPACRWLAGKAHVRLGRDELAAQAWAGDQLLWTRLVGRTAIIPQSVDDLHFLERYYGILRDVDPDQAAPYFMIGSVYRSQGGWQKSIPFFEKAVALEPDNARYLCALGEALVVSKQDVLRGANLCRTAQFLTPKDMWVQEQVARTLATTGECTAAAEIYQTLVDTFAERPEPQEWLKAFQKGTIGECDVSATK